MELEASLLLLVRHLLLEAMHLFLVANLVQCQGVDFDGGGNLQIGPSGVMVGHKV